MTTPTTSRWSPKDPQDIRDYWIDFSSLLPPGVTISTATVTIAAAQHAFTAPYTDLVKVESVVVTPKVRMRVSGGTPQNTTGASQRNTYKVQYHLVASDGQELDVTKNLIVKERTA